MSRTHFFGFREHLDHEWIGYPFREVVFMVIRERLSTRRNTLFSRKGRRSVVPHGLT